MKKRRINNNAAGDMLTTQQVADELGVAPKTVLKYMKRPNSPLPAVRYNKKTGPYYFASADVQRFKQQCRVIADADNRDEQAATAQGGGHG